MRRYLFLFVLAFLPLFFLPAQSRVHKIQKGDTLYSIARQYGVSVESIVALNAIKDPGKIIPGESLQIPHDDAKNEYIVKKGDTLYSIARAHATTVDMIKTLNKLKTDSIMPGQVLSLPGSGNPVSTAATESGPISTTVSPDSKPLSQGTGTSVTAGNWPASGELSKIQGKLTGIAISTKPGADISAVRSGTVISLGPFRSFGNVAFVQASDGLVYVYGGAATLKVRVGDSVRKGSVLGSAEADGDGKASVYFFVFRGGDSIDPVNAPRT